MDYFLAGAFLAAGFFAAGFLAAGFLAGALSAAALAGAFFAAAFFFGAAFRLVLSGYRVVMGCASLPRDLPDFGPRVNRRGYCGISNLSLSPSEYGLARIKPYRVCG